MVKQVCIICSRSVEEKEAVKCSICGVPMHKSCIDEEVLSDAEGNILCPRCAAIAALDWLDNIISLYAHSITGEDRGEIIDRLKTMVKLLEG